MSAAPGRARLPQAQDSEAASEKVRLRQAENLAALNILLGGIAHNLANPLTAIGSFLTMLPEQWATNEKFREHDYPRVLQDMARVQQQIESLTRIAVTPELGLADPWKVEVLAAELRLYALGRAAEREVSLEVQVDSSEATLVQSREVVKQIMIVLLDNACAFAARGGRIEFQISGLAQAEGRELSFRVRDDGPGVAADATEKIFDPFYSTRKGGMGVGLFVGRQLARACGGELRLLDGKKGAFFELVMPLAPA
jgi:signal transduction histidine kinase